MGWRLHPTPTHRSPLLGSSTPRRECILSEAAPLLWDCNADIRLFEFPKPMIEPRAHFVVSTAKWELLASSRVLLNIHRHEVPYFEWVRVLEAVVNGCLVVSETSADYGPLIPGEHLIAAPSELLGAYTASIMTDEALRTDLAAAAYDFVRTKLELKTLLEPICAHVEDVVIHVPRHRKALPFRSATLRHATPSPAAAEGPPTPCAIYGPGSRSCSMERPTCCSGSRRCRQARLLHGDADHVDVFVTRAWGGFVPDVSVVVTSCRLSGARRRGNRISDELVGGDRGIDRRR